MFIFILCFLLLVTLFFLLFKKIRLGVVTLFIFFLVFLAIGTGLVPHCLVSHLQNGYLNAAKPVWKKNNVIILLGAGLVKLPAEDLIEPSLTAYSRIHRAANLYFQCVKTSGACKILVSGGDPTHLGKSEAFTYKIDLIALGIPEKAIFLEPDSLNTYQNTEFTSSLLKRNHFDQILLVTSGIHLKRSLLYFSNFHIQPKPMMADYIESRIVSFPNGYNFAVMDAAMHEYMGILRFYFYNFMGWNKNV
jgi:uncharacterized SAM-binding protein YcdF (DUF218 family)